MWNTLIYLWETICLPWKAWLAFLSFLLGLWFAWLLWGPWLKRLQKGIVRERDLSLEVAALRCQAREASSDLKAEVAAPVLPSHFAGEDMTLSSKFGWIYNRKPEDADDFSLLAGLKPDGGDLLGKLGIHKFKQIAHLKDEELNALPSHDSKLQGPEWSQWRTHFESFESLPEIPEGLEGQSVEVSPTLGLLYRESPANSDELSQLHGIYPSLAKSLNRWGVYRYDQIASLSDAQIAAWEKQDPEFVKLPWRAWRKRFQSSEGLVPPATLKGEAVKWSPQFGWIFAARPKKADQLTLVEGVGSEQVADLHRLGIYQFSQIAEWSDDDIAALEKEAPSLHGIDWSYWRLKFKKSGGRLELPKGLQDEELTLSPKLGLVYTAEPASKDDLSLLQGADKAAEQDWNRAGLYRYQQIAHLNDAQIGDWQKEAPAAKGFDWNAWRDRLKSSEATMEVPSEFEGEPVQVSPTLGIVYPYPPREVDDFTRLQGVSTQAVGSLNRSGVYRYRQISNLSDSEIEQLSGRDASLKTVDWKAWRAYFQTHGDAIEVPGAWKGEPVGLSPKLGFVYSEAPQDADELCRLKGIDSATEQAMNVMGLYRYEQLAQLSDAQVEAWKSADSRFCQVDWEYWRVYFGNGQSPTTPAAFAGEPIQHCPLLGVVYSQVPDTLDQLTLLQGVSEKQAKRLHELGIYRFKQIAHWDDATIQELVSRYPELKGIRWAEWRRRFTEEGFALPVPQAFASEVVQLSPRFGVVYPEAPDESDQLALMDGVTTQSEKQLYELGFYRFKQIANLTDTQIDALRSESPELKRMGWNLWRAHLHIHGEKKATTLARLRQGVPLEFAEENQVSQGVELGTVYRYAPRQVDKLSEIEGIDEEMERLLNGWGIYTFRQLAFLRAPQFVALSSRDGRFQGFRETLHRRRTSSCASVGSHWRWQSWDLKAAEGLTSEPEFGAVFDAKPSHVDQLSCLPGVSGVGAIMLKDLGIYHFEQIVQLTDAQIASLGEKRACLKQLNPAQLRFAASRYLGKIVSKDLPTTDA